jgi:hypothetical protein
MVDAGDIEPGLEHWPRTKRLLSQSCGACRILAVKRLPVALQAASFATRPVIFVIVGGVQDTFGSISICSSRLMYRKRKSGQKKLW